MVVYQARRGQAEGEPCVMRYLLERIHDHGLNRFLLRNKRHLTATMYMHNHLDRNGPYRVRTETMYMQL